MQKTRKIVTILLVITLMIGVGGLAFFAVTKSVSQNAHDNALDVAGIAPLITSEPEDTSCDAVTEEFTEEITERAEESISEETEKAPEELTAALLDDTSAKALAKVDLDAMQKLNGDVIGWILIPDTSVSHPLLQGRSNTYYLRQTWEKTWNLAGSIFLDSTLDPTFDNFNTIIYGHNMRDGTMFSHLLNFSDEQYLNDHKYLYLLSEKGVHKYEVFAVYTAHIRDEIYGIGSFSDKRKQSLIDFALEKSEIDTAIVPTVDDRIVTLSTCTVVSHPEYRWIVQYVERDFLPREAFDLE